MPVALASVASNEIVTDGGEETRSQVNKQVLIKTSLLVKRAEEEATYESAPDTQEKVDETPCESLYATVPALHEVIESAFLNWRSITERA